MTFTPEIVALWLDMDSGPDGRWVFRHISDGRSFSDAERALVMEATADDMDALQSVFAAQLDQLDAEHSDVSRMTELLNPWPGLTLSEALPLMSPADCAEALQIAVRVGRPA